MVVIPLCVIFGSIIGGYIFVKINSEKSFRTNQTQEMSQAIYETDNSSPLPIGVVLDSVNEKQNIADNMTTESIKADENNLNQAPQNEENRNETTLTTSNSTRRQPAIDWIAPTAENNRTETRRVIQPNKVIDDKNKALTNNTSQSPLSNVSSTTFDDNRNTPMQKAKLPTRVKMAAGSSLTQIAAEYYGDKVFWVYIFEHNKGRIKNFDNIPVGTELQLPAPNTYGIDAKNNFSLQRARQKQAQLTK
jgi:nucleoid-associated protein YgaU